MFDAWFSERKAEFQGWLHDLHRNPELGFEEHRTAAFVAERLRQAGFEVSTAVGGTGVVGVFRGKGGKGTGRGRTIALRAELDALPLKEAADIGYRSEVEGKAHACGHDGHTVTLLTAACYLAQSNSLPGTVVCIFQPAEELLEGASAMLADGPFERFPCDEIYALHNIPGLSRGHVGVVRGGALASCDDITVTVHATGTHGSAPHTGEDAIVAAATFLSTLQQTVTRVIDSRDSGVISFGRIAGGCAGNILPDLVEISGTMRTHATAVRECLVQQIERVCEFRRNSWPVERRRGAVCAGVKPGHWLGSELFRIGGAEPPRRYDRSLQRLIAQARNFNDLVMRSNARSMRDLAAKVGVSGSYFTRVFRLNFLAPDITKAILQGRQPPELSAIKLMSTGQFAGCWSAQRRQMGFD